MFLQEARVARVLRIGRRVPLFDAVLLAGEFERIPQECEAKDTGGSCKLDV